MLPQEKCIKYQKNIEANLSEYAGQSGGLNWITPERAVVAEHERKKILEAMSSTISFSCNQTKPHLGSLSPGCRICTEGGWSCLFISGKCNCRCFYCPTAQNEIGIPTTNRIPFAKSKNYAAYIRHFGFKGVSISGGEPLITFDQTIRYIREVRRKSGDNLHIWMYTNGTLLKSEHIDALKIAGLNEIRFDLTAVDYDLKKISLAAGKIPFITVEIPAIPEDSERLTALLPDLVSAGVNFLNLHQLRLTPYNCERLISRGYTYLHGQKVTVLESELAALAVMQKAEASGIKLPINYCSFIYKHTYQQMAARKRNAPEIAKSYEGITQNGYVRSLSLVGPVERLSQQTEHLLRAKADSSKWQFTYAKDRLYFHESLWPLIDFQGLELRVSYYEAILSAQNSYRHQFKEIRLTPKFNLVMEKQPRLVDTIISSDQRVAFEIGLTSSSGEDSLWSETLASDILDYERINFGLQDYY